MQLWKNKAADERDALNAKCEKLQEQLAFKEQVITETTADAKCKKYQEQLALKEQVITETTAERDALNAKCKK